MIVEKLPPAPTDKLVGWCRIAQEHVWTREWLLYRFYPYKHKPNLSTYKLCLRCCEYIIQDPRVSNLLIWER